MSNVVNITKENFEKEVLLSDKKVLVDFYADWCGPCQMLKPTVEALSKEHDNVKFAFVNVDKNPELAQAFMIMSIPALFVVEDGKITSKQVGVLNKPQLNAFINA